MGLGLVVEIKIGIIEFFKNGMRDFINICLFMWNFSKPLSIAFIIILAFFIWAIITQDFSKEKEPKRPKKTECEIMEKIKEWENKSSCKESEIERKGGFISALKWVLGDFEQ